MLPSVTNILAEFFRCGLPLHFPAFSPTTQAMSGLSSAMRFAFVPISLARLIPRSSLSRGTVSAGRSGATCLRPEDLRLATAEVHRQDRIENPELGSEDLTYRP